MHGLWMFAAEGDQSQAAPENYRLRGTMSKKERLEIANKLIDVIAACGRKFFAKEERVSKFEIDARGKIWFIDAYSQKRIYTHHKGRWRGFTNGGTLRALVENLRDFINNGTQISNPYTFGPWPDHIAQGDLWGYGDDMQAVRDAALSLGITKTKSDAKTEGAWIRFEVAGSKPKTTVWNVVAKQGDVILGQIAWFARWRGYAFFPKPDMVFETTCLIDITRFIGQQNSEQRKKKVQA